MPGLRRAVGPTLVEMSDTSQSLGHSWGVTGIFLEEVLERLPAGGS